MDGSHTVSFRIDIFLFQYMVGLCCYLCIFIDGKVLYSYVLQTRRFHIIMFMHNKMFAVRFNFQKPNDTSTLDIEGTNIFFNLTRVGNLLMNGTVPWRGGRERDPLSMQAFIKALTKHEGVILSAYVSTSVAFLFCISIPRMQCVCYIQLFIVVICFKPSKCIHPCLQWDAVITS